MKNKFINFILVLALIIPCMFGVVACNQNPPDEPMTNAELSTTYKEVAVGTWESIGVSNPTAQQVSLAAPVPDKKVETTITAEINNIKMNTNSFAGLIYMIGLLYGNENFQPTNGIAKFNVQVTVGSQLIDQDYIIKPSVDKVNNKVYLEACVEVDSGIQYNYVEIDYDFAAKEVKSFRYYTSVMGTYIDMSLTEDGKYKFYSTSDATDDFAAALIAKKAEFENATQNIQALTTNFSAEIQIYMNVVQNALSQLM